MKTLLSRLLSVAGIAPAAPALSPKGLPTDRDLTEPAIKSGLNRAQRRARAYGNNRATAGRHSERVTKPQRV